MADLLKGENSGVIVDVRETDFKAGAVSGITYQVVNQSGDWTPDKPTDEWQRRYIPPSTLGYDTNSCTDFSGLNGVEVQIEYMMANGLIPIATIQKMHDLGMFDAQGNVNFNDWYNAITAGTTDASGNTLYAVWDAIRKYGLIPQSMGHAPNDFTTASQWFSAKVTPAMNETAKAFLDIFDVAYEWVNMGNLNQSDLYDTHLKQAPLHVLVPTGASWNNPVVTNNGPYTGVNHAVLLVAQNGKTHTILDHYNPFVKQLEWGYYIPYALKGVVTLKGAVPPILSPYQFTKDLEAGMTDPDVLKLQQYLNAHGFPLAAAGTPGSAGHETDYFGVATRGAVARYQTAHGIKPNVGYFGPATRKSVNSNP